MIDPVRFAKAVAEKIATGIKSALELVEARLDTLESRAAVPGPAGRDGIDGKDGAAGRDGRDGANGIDGKDGPVGPAGANGMDGEPGAGGADGAPGERGEKGLDGSHGRDGIDGVAGKDGVGLAGAVITKDGELAVTLTDGTIHRLGPVVGQKGDRGDQGEQGLSGKDGADGTLLSLKALAAEMRPTLDEDGRTVKWLWSDGSPVEGWSVKFQTVLYRGIWQDGQAYAKGDSVTFGGSQWIAKDDTTAKPGDASAPARAWQLAVKKGADGKPGQNGPQGPQGTKGDKGDKGDRGFDR